MKTEKRIRVILEITLVLSHFLYFFSLYLFIFYYIYLIMSYILLHIVILT